jgi:hypothetical protein
MKTKKVKLDPRKDDVSLILDDMDRFFNNLMKSKKKSLEFLASANIIALETDANKVKIESK